MMATASSLEQNIGLFLRLDRNSAYQLPFIFSFLGLDFPTPFGRILPHSFGFDFYESSLSGPFRSLSRGGCLPASGGVTSAAV